MPNVDDGDARTRYLANGWSANPLPARALYNVILDPLEKSNRVDEAACREIAFALDARLTAWMATTDDPLRDPDSMPPPHFRLDKRDGGLLKA